MLFTHNATHYFCSKTFSQPSQILFSYSDWEVHHHITNMGRRSKNKQQQNGGQTDANNDEEHFPATVLLALHPGGTITAIAAKKSVRVWDSRYELLLLMFDCSIKHVQQHFLSTPQHQHQHYPPPDCRQPALHKHPHCTMPQLFPQWRVPADCWG